MINKVLASAADALKDVHDGATVMIGGFGTAGLPNELVDALIDQGARELTIVNNNAGNGDTGLAALLGKGRVRKIICSFPRLTDSWHFDKLYREGRIELELVPQGNLAERIRAAGAGIGGFFTPTGYGTELAKGKETRIIDGRGYVLESPIHADFALIKAERGDRWGNHVPHDGAELWADHGFSSEGYGGDCPRARVARGEPDPLYLRPRSFAPTHAADRNRTDRLVANARARPRKSEIRVPAI